MKTFMLVFAAAALVACNKDVETDSAGSVDTARDTVTRISVPDIDIGMKRDTLSLPTLDKRGDTLIMGRKKVEISRPTVDVNKKP
jgi:hypothetical protein